MSDSAWIEAALTEARSQVTRGLSGYFRGLDMTEEACEEAALRASSRDRRLGQQRRDHSQGGVQIPDGVQGRNVARDQRHGAVHGMLVRLGRRE